VVLDEGFLQYYGSEKDYDEGRKSKREEPIDLRFYGVVPHGTDPRRFDLLPTTSYARPGMVVTSVRGREVPRVFSFRAETEAARPGWVAAFEREGCVPAAVLRKMQQEEGRGRDK
jgi:hypothetical protein